MNLETFFEKFDQFTDAPDAVARMRELVLNLAVQGRLVEQDSADEDVQLLLARNDETRRVTAKSDRRADDENQPLLSGDDRWDIPESWSWRALADLVLFVDYRGKTPAKLSDGIRLLTAKNVRKGEINLAPEEFLSEEEYHAWMTRGFPKAGDVLFTTEAPMGNAAVVKLTDRFALAQRVICFQSYGAVDSSFLVLQILSTQFQAILDKNGTGVTAKGIKASKLKQLPIALPPLAEQKRIVAKVDELMALCDRLEAQQQERQTRHAALARASLARFADAPTPANLHFLFHPSYAISPADLRKSILTLAVQGGLVPHLEGESGVAYASVEDADPINVSSVPKNWRVVPLSNAITNRSGNSKLIKGRLHEEPAAGRFQGFSASGADVWCDDYEHEGQAIIISAVGARCGKAFKASGKWSAIANTTITWPEPALLDFDFAFLVLNNEHFWVRGGSAQPFVKFPPSLKRHFALPPLAEQRRIVAKVEQLMALVDALETQLAASRATAEKLLAAMVAELTEGTHASTAC
jgi:type I restriction enzyme S subunit